MELHRSRTGVFVGVLFVAAGAGFLAYTFTTPDMHIVFRLMFGLVPLVIGAWGTYNAVRPFRFHIGQEGLTLRTKGINRLVGWSEVYAVVRTSTGLLLVPSSSSFDVKLDTVSRVDGRPCLEILVFDDVKERPDDVAEALSRFGGDRFVDAGEETVLAPQSFTIVLRGYDPAAVDALIARAARHQGDEAARAQLKRDLDQGLPIVMRGYDRAQVDAYLKHLMA